MAPSSRSDTADDSSPARAPDRGPALDELPVELRPNESLLTYYLLSSLLLGPFFPLLFVPRFFRYHTLRYRIDEEGISMQWGAFFHREISLSYARIQDIHLSSNVLERRLGLGKIQIQTASASAGAEMTIEGIPGLERVRDFLYARMRGAKDERPTESEPTTASGDELTATLHAVVDEIRGLREDLRGGGTGRAPGKGPRHG